MHSRTIQPARNVLGTIAPPGDKSISHRYAMLAAIATGRSTIHGFASAADCASTLQCLCAMGVPVETTKEAVVIEGRGLRGLRAPSQVLDAGNSGSTIRMMAGILAAQNFRSEITGDESLQRRPMRRIMDPLAQMGARITARDGNFPPLVIEGRPLKGIRYALPVPSAQVKTAVLFAGLFAEGDTIVEEQVKSRDHTEIALIEFGAEIETAYKRTRVCGGRALRGTALRVPGDLSSAAFFIVAALLFPESNLTVVNTGLNPTRAQLLDVLRGMGADVRVSNIDSVNGELVGDLHVTGGGLRGGSIGPEQVPGVIDELPVLAVLGTATEQGLTISGAQELRVKESDRIATVAENLRRMGAQVEERPDGLIIPGRQKLRGASVNSYGDHRIAMAFAVAALAAHGPTTIEGATAAQVSFPEFYDMLSSVTEA